MGEPDLRVAGCIAGSHLLSTFAEMARVSPSFALSYGTSTGLFGGNVVGKGTPEQIERFALPVLRTEKIGCWALTEPGSGSDALGGMKTRARRDGAVGPRFLRSRQ